MAKKRILTGDTPTGKLHIGHYVGTLENRVKLQNEYETFILSADTHALSTLSKTPTVIGEHTFQNVLDNLAVGLDPKNVVFWTESGVPELYELAAIMSMYVAHNRALRNPTVKDEIKMKGLGDHFSLGFVNYPIFQAADILGVKAHLVPVGVDQVAHLEQSREIARDLNAITETELFPIPEVLVGRVGKLVGTDGNPKMGKSLGNTIYLGESKEEVQKKVMGMYTDPMRIRATDPGTVEGNPVFIYLDLFGTDSDASAVADFKARYVEGKVGDIEVKQYLAGVMERFLAPIRERREYFEARPDVVRQIMIDGTLRAREENALTLKELRTLLNLSVFVG